MAAVENAVKNGDVVATATVEAKGACGCNGMQGTGLRQLQRMRQKKATVAATAY